MRARRLARSFLCERAPPGRLVDVVRDVGGIHAQVQASAELQLATRIDEITQADVRHALWSQRSLVKAWTLRGTLHLHPADELPLWFAARRAVSAKAKELPAWPDPHGVVHPPVSGEEVDELQASVREALKGRALLREELVTAVLERTRTRHEGRLRSGFAFFFSELCQGPPQGSKITLARPDQWVADWKEVDEQDALREVLKRFFSAYGPTREREFRAWFGGEAPFDLVELEEVDVDGHRAFVLAGDTEFPPPVRTLRLLPEYDVYVMGFRERGQLVPESVRDQVASHGRGRYEGPAGVRFVVVDGSAAGLWERTRRAKRIELRVMPARKLTRVQQSALAGEAERIGAFLGLESQLRVE